MALFLILSMIIVLGLGYGFYVRRVGKILVDAALRRAAPARRLMDGKEFMPAPTGVLFGYHFKAITLDAVLGPVIAVQFGWLPAILWLVLGVLLAGWVQDYTTLILSMRSAGAGLGNLAGSLISPFARSLLLALLYIYLLSIAGALGVIIAPLMARESVSVGVLLLVAAGLLVGQMIYRWRMNLYIVAPIAVLLALASIYGGSMPWAQSTVRAVNSLAGLLMENPLGYGDLAWANLFWGLTLLGIAFLGAVFPIWRFTQPVNFTASWLFFISLGLAIIGILFATLTGSVNTGFQIPVLVTAIQPHLGPLWPVLFVTISGGAISGWHALVTTYSTSRQAEKEALALPLTAGAAFIETMLAVLAVVFAITLGVSAGRYDPNQNYALIAGPASVFTSGMAQFLGVLGFSENLADTLGIGLLVLMALTVLQLVLRFMRIISADLLGENLPIFKSPWFGAMVGFLLSIFLIVFGFWQWLWVLFGGANLVVAGIALLLVSIWLAQQNRPYRWTLWPGLLVFFTAIAALLHVSLYNAIYKGLLQSEGQGFGFILGNSISAVSGLIVCVTALILFVAGLRALQQARLKVGN